MRRRNKEKPTSSFDTTKTRCLLCTAAQCTVLFPRVLPPMVFQSQEAPIAEAILQCPRCGIVFTSSNLSHESAAKVYAQVYKKDSGFTDRLYFWYYALSRRVKGLWPGKRVLEVGIGEGRYMAFLKKKRIDVYGVEISDEAIASALRKGIDRQRIWNGDFEKAEYPNESFDFIMMWQLLEHIGEPAKTLKKCHELLKEEGRLVIGLLPNFGSLERALFGRHNSFLGVPYHVIHYTPDSISRVLAENGFRIHSLSFDFFTPTYFIQSLVKLLEECVHHEIPIDVMKMTSLILMPLLLPLNIICTLLKKGTTMNIVAVKQSEISSVKGKGE